MTVRRFCVIYLSLQSLGAIVWWGVLLGWPNARQAFLAKGAPDSTLFAFALPDGILFIAAGALAAYGIAKQRTWAWPTLCIHAGAAAYAALECWSLTILTAGDGIIGSLLMTPSLVIPGYLVFALRPRGERC